MSIVVPALTRPAGSSRRLLGAMCVLVVGLWVMYTVIGLLVLRAPGRPMYERELLFEADIPRVTLDITSTEGPHWRSSVHPLFVLLANPPGSLFAKVLGGRTTSAAIVFNALAGALAAACAFRLFWGLSGGHLPRAALATLVAALAMSRVVFSSIPETYSLASLSVLVTYLVFWLDLQERRLPLWVWVAAGTFAMGVTITNVVQTLLCYLVARDGRPDESKLQAVAATAGFGLLVAGCVAVLNVVQGLLYPSTGLLQFLTPSELGRESWFIQLEILRAPAEVLSELFKNFFVFNVVGGIPAVVEGISDQPRLTYGGSWAFSPMGYVALATWGGLIVAGLSRPAVTSHGRFYAGVGLCVLFNLLLHAVYFGRTVVIEYFLYTSNFTFAVMVLILGRWVSVPGRLGTWALCAFLAALAVNNLDVVRRIIAHYT